MPLSSYVWSHFARLWTLRLPQNFEGHIRTCYAMVLSCKFSTWFMLWFPKFVHVFVDSFLLEFQSGCQFSTTTWMWLPAKCAATSSEPNNYLNSHFSFPSRPKYVPIHPLNHTWLPRVRTVLVTSSQVGYLEEKSCSKYTTKIWAGLYLRWNCVGHGWVLQCLEYRYQNVLENRFQMTIYGGEMKGS